MGKDGILNKIKFSDPLKKSKSTYSIVSCSEVTEGALEVWRGLPEIIRDDPSLASFRQQHEKLHGELKTIFCLCLFNLDPRKMKKKKFKKFNMKKSLMPFTT